MPAVCNLFSALTKKTGNFLLFSQYTEDLTHQISAGSIYKVVPSKFICAEIDYARGSNGSVNWNEQFPLWLQNNYENCVADMREHGSVTPDDARNLFWNCLFGDPADPDKNYLSISNGSVDQFRYVGTIDLQSFSQDTGMGYSEIYCYIPSEGSRCSIGADFDSSKTSIATIPAGTVHGYSDGEEVNGVLSLQHPETQYYTERRFKFSFEKDNNTAAVTKILDDNSFKFNTIIVLYDILQQNGDVMITKAHDIPMGMHLTGLIRGQEYADEGYPLNEVTKYVSNEDIYGAGTSYGLRICSRFTPVPGSDSIKNVELSTDSDNGAALSRVYGMMADTARTMENVVEELYKHSQAPKELLAIFKNSRTNVPYIKEVNGEKMWFCNGRSLDATLSEITDSNSDCEPASGAEIQAVIDQYERELVPTLTIRASSNIALFETGTTGDVTLTFDIFYKGERIDVSELDNLSVDGQNIKTTTFKQNLTNTHTFKVVALKGTLEASTSALVQSVYPSYVGGIEVVNENSISDLTKILYSTWKNQWVLNSSSSQYPVLAYPASFGRVGVFRDADSGVNITDKFGAIGMDGLCEPILIQINGIDYNVYKYSEPGFRKRWKVLAELRK